MNWIQGKRKEITNNYENAKQLNRLNQSRVHPKFTCSMLDVCVHVHKHKNGFSTFYIDYATEIFINFFISLCVCVCWSIFFSTVHLRCNHSSVVTVSRQLETSFIANGHTLINTCILITHGFQKSLALLKPR